MVEAEGLALIHRYSTYVPDLAHAEGDLLGAQAKCREVQGLARVFFLSVAVIRSEYSGCWTPWFRDGNGGRGRGYDER